MERYNLEVLQFDALFVDEKGNRTKCNYHFNLNTYTHCFSGYEYIEIEIPYWERPVASWCRIFNKEFLTTNQILFPETTYGEDEFHSMNVLLNVKKLQVINEHPIYYRIREDSTMTQKNTRKRNSIRTSDRVYLSALSLINFNQFNLPLKTRKILTDYCIHIIINSQKTIFYFPIKEKMIFYKRMNDLDLKVLNRHLTSNNYLYNHLQLFFIISIVLGPLLSIIRDIKRSLS